MSPADLAQRIAALDWSATSLQHQLAISAAVETLSGTPMPVSYPYQPGDPRFDGADAFECFGTMDEVRFKPGEFKNIITIPVRQRTCWTTICHLDGRKWATSSHFGPTGAWAWVVESVAAEHDVSEDQIGCIEGDDRDDLVTIDGLPVYRISHLSSRD